MSILLSDLKFYAAAVVPEDDAVTNIGGAHDVTKKFDFSDFAGLWQIVSDNAGDTVAGTNRSVTLSYRDLTQAILTETKFFNGLTPVTGASTIERIEKAVKSGSTTGNTALESQTAVFTGTLPVQAGLAADQVLFPAGASGSTGIYNGMVFRATAGTGINKLLEVIDYDGATKIATMNKTVTGFFDNTTVIRISNGVFFDKTPNEIVYVVRMDYNSSADPSGGSDRDFYIKGFFEHTDASGSGLTATSCVVREFADPSTQNTFGLDASKNATTDNGAFNRQVAPGAITFDNADKNVPTGSMAPGDRIGVWKKLHRVNGALALKTTWTPQLRVQTT